MLMAAHMCMAWPFCDLCLVFNKKMHYGLYNELNILKKQLNVCNTLFSVYFNTSPYIDYVAFDLCVLAIYLLL